jgi:hypothetical protein
MPTIIKSSKKLQERNQFVVAALFRKAGAHRKTNKAIRKKENQDVRMLNYR